MEEFIKESIEVSQEDELLEAYDKEWALKDQGFRDGKEEGMKQFRHEIVRKMLEEKCEIGLIMKVTGLSEKEIEAYQNM